jgi:hypothetical protein
MIGCLSMCVCGGSSYPDACLSFIFVHKFSILSLNLYNIDHKILYNIDHNLNSSIKKRHLFWDGENSY